MENLLTKKQLAKYAGVTTRTIDNWAKKGMVTPLKASPRHGVVRFDAGEVKNLFKNQKSDK